MTTNTQLTLDAQTVVDNAPCTLTLDEARAYIRQVMILNDVTQEDAAVILISNFQVAAETMSDIEQG